MERRKLQLGNLDEAVEEAEQLLAKGYRSTGNWNLAQTLGHCSDWLRFPMDGYPRAKFPVNFLLAIARWTIGKSASRKLLRDRTFPPGRPTMSETVKQPLATQDATALKDFKQTVERFKSFTGQPQASPLFGALTYDQHLELQLIHIQHHLSFLIPVEPKS
jgi:hypothetical protein